jgi:hypothetical protein
MTYAYLPSELRTSGIARAPLTPLGFAVLLFPGLGARGRRMK